MRPRQVGFDFDLFDLAGVTRTPVEDAGAWARADAYKAQQDAERRERETRERFTREREQREQREREQREREEKARRDWQARQRSTQYESPWDVLGVLPGAGKKEIRSAWVRKCKAHHPDAGGNLDAMKRVNKAYQDLKGQMR